MVAISETRITKQVFLLVMSNLNNCSKEFCPAETSGNFTLLYVHNNLLNKCKNQLNIYKRVIFLLKQSTPDNQILLWGPPT